MIRRENKLIQWADSPLLGSHPPLVRIVDVGADVA